MTTTANAGYLVVGRSVIDAHLQAQEVTLAPGQVRLPVEAPPLVLSYRGAPLTWGGKRTACRDLSFLRPYPGTELRPGGGAWNTAAALANAGSDQSHPPRVVLVDACGPTPELDQAAALLGIQRLAVGTALAPVHLVLTVGGGENRCILRSPIPPADPDLLQLGELAARAPDPWRGAPDQLARFLGARGRRGRPGDGTGHSPVFGPHHLASGRGADRAVAGP